jgi:Fe-S-cluster-containing hydrogenase component 2
MPASRSKLSAHPTVAAVRNSGRREKPVATLDSAELRELCLEAGADDVGFVSIDDPTLEIDRQDARDALPGAQTLISICVRMNRDNVRSPMRSIANHEFHESYSEVNEVGREIVSRLERRGVRAVSPPAAFPQEIGRGLAQKIWVISHKLVAVAAGLGHMGVHRCVIHPRFGSFILLETILMQPHVSDLSAPLEWSPCLECNLCVAACPVGAIDKDGTFDMLSCYTHNYREFMGGFSDWVEQVVEADDAADYRARVSDTETLSIWQSLSYRPNYKAAYCVSVCPAGEDVIGPFLDDRARHVREVVRPLQQKREDVYVLPESRAEKHVTRRFTNKTPRRVGNGLR